jgi:hypothetical protein
MTHSTAALRQLKKLGHDIPGGDRVRFVITDAQNRDSDLRVRIESRTQPGMAYDAQAYRILLVRALTSLLLPLGYDETAVDDALSGAPHQVMLPGIT